MESTVLMKRSSLSITPETAIVHIACALGGNLVSVYRNSLDKVKEWGPISEKSIVVMSNNRRDINDVDSSKITDAVKNCLMEMKGVENG